MLLALLIAAAGCGRQPAQMPIFTYVPPQTSMTPGPSSTPATLTGWQVDEGLLFSAPGLPNNQLFDISPDGKQMAYVAAKGSGETLVVNGVESPAYDRIARDEWGVAAIYSPDSRHIAFRALKQGQWRVVSDGIESQPYPDVGIPFFSPDSQRLGFKAYSGNHDRHEGDQQFMVTDGIEGAPYADILYAPVQSGQPKTGLYRQKHRWLLPGCQRRRRQDLLPGKYIYLQS